MFNKSFKLIIKNFHGTLCGNDKLIIKRKEKEERTIEKTRRFVAMVKNNRASEFR